MKARVVDLETTGMPPEAKICELAWTDVHENGSIDETHAFLINPGIPIPPEARAIHHISDHDVILAPSLELVLSDMMEEMEPGDFLCAHNAAFEREFLSHLPFSWICTMKCAQHLWRTAPGYSNQTLRYWRNVPAEWSRSMPPHRAGPDTYVTAHILSELLDYPMTFAGLADLTKRPILLRTVGFGKHRGMEWSNVPRSYLQWIVDKSGMDGDVRHTAKHYLQKGPKA